MDEKGAFSKEELKRRQDDNELDLSLCSIVKVPVKQISSLHKVTVIDLSCNKITELPDSFCSLTKLVQLDLSKNSLVSLPAKFGNLNNLRRLDLYSNNLVSLPLSFGDLRLLKWLDLKDNPVQTDLPGIVGDCLEPKECENCAIRMLNFMLEMRAQEEKRRAIEAEKERRKKAEEEVEAQKLNELRKREKKEEKERRRKAYLEEQKIVQNSQILDDKKKQNGADAGNADIIKTDSVRTNGPSLLANLMRLSLMILLLAVALYLYRDQVILLLNGK